MEIYPKLLESSILARSVDGIGFLVKLGLNLNIGSKKEGQSMLSFAIQHSPPPVVAEMFKNGAIPGTDEDLTSIVFSDGVPYFFEKTKVLHQFNQFKVVD